VRKNEVFENVLVREQKIQIYIYNLIISIQIIFFFFFITSRPTVGLTQPPIQRVLGAPSWGGSGRGVKLTTHINLVRRS
jgi:hypothetical protein